MADLLNTGISALMGYRKALDTAGHNIANVNTDGYTRQRVEFVSRLGGPQGDGYIGSGVSTSTVKRITDAFVGARIVADTSAYERAAAFEGVVGQLDTWLSDSTTGLGAPLTAFFDSLNDLSANPSSTANRQSVLSDAQSLATRFHSLSGQIDSLQSELNARVRQDVEEINAAARDIAALNERITLATGAAGGQPPNDLLDQRDQLIQKLAGKIGITTTEGDDGSISVFAGNGQGLVIGSRAAALGVADDAYGSGRLDVTFNGIAVTAQIGSGSLGGLLDAQHEVIDPARAKLGRLAVGLTEAFNTQHRLGVDATGTAGGDFFAPLGSAGLGARTNTGGAAIDVGFADVSQLGDADYEMSFDGASWSLRNASTGAAVSMTGTGTVGDPFLADGLRITVSGAAAAGDRFSLQPTARAAADLSVAITDPARLAAAAAGSAANSSDNTNARALLGLGTQRVLDGGRNTFASANTALVSGVGNQAQQAGVARSAQESLLSQSIAARDATSGVNLDEEAADLVRFQQAYQAAAQVIAVADTVFQTLLAATQR
ncbi:MAG: flgK [Panacagrimonas sp.]|jgi:flagellar hook-associated protein 1 FlgK|nr:flagellar hook-associated protein FlgK [Panacagrimonas sp.]MCC2658578.1 flgK [Panacagrimonas sp.]